jgi:hypothetical protein
MDMKRWYPYLLMVFLGIAILGYLVVKLNYPIDLAVIWQDMVNPTSQTTPSDLETTPDVNKVPKEVVELRQRHQLRPLTESEEGRKLQDLPHGIYGFSMCGVPSVRAKRDKTSLLEIHKRTDGIVYYVGYASEDHIDNYLARQRNFHIMTSPKSSERTPLLFEIPIDFVFKCEMRPFKEGYLFDLFITVIPELKE